MARPSSCHMISGPAAPAFPITCGRIRCAGLLLFLIINSVPFESEYARNPGTRGAYCCSQSFIRRTRGNRSRLPADRKRVVEGKRGGVRVVFVGGRIRKKK